MRNFIIFFDEKEGTSALVHLLDKFECISIVRLPAGWEPFDRHWCGPMSLRNLDRCLRLIFARDPALFARVEEIYTKTSHSMLQEFRCDAALGFKMRFVPPWPDPSNFPVIQPFKLAARLFGKYRQWAFMKTMIELLWQEKVAVILAVRQDLLRWALSKYHGDGTGNPGHLQFRMARGEIRREELGKLTVDIPRLSEILSECEKIHARKRHLEQSLRMAGIDVHRFRYEEFLDAKESCIRGILDFLDVRVPVDELNRALRQEEYLKKVHPHDIAEFVENHREVEEHFGDRFAAWS